MENEEESRGTLNDFAFNKREETQMTEFLSASSLKLGEQGTMKVVSFEGLNAFERPQIKVEVAGKTYLFGINKTNEDILAGVYKKVSEIIGKELKFVVVATQKGNSIQLLV